jgi:3-phenylpropionate/cinnamic acid dioxygenase small subunit
MEHPVMNEDLCCEVQQFLYREARLLDERRFRDWLGLFTEDARYWMGARSNRYPKTSKAIAILNPDRYVEDDLTKEGDLAIFDETREDLARRIARLETGMAWVRWNQILIEESNEAA